jgi:hypothetical protein
MTEYTDVPAANALHQESQQIAQALTNLEAGGSLASMLIAPPPPAPPDPGQPMAPMMMSVQVTVPPPTTPELAAQITAWLNQRLTDIATELTALGVTVPPPSQMRVAPQAPSLPTMPPRPQPRGVAA